MNQLIFETSCVCIINELIYEAANPINYYSMPIIMIITWAQLLTMLHGSLRQKSDGNWIKFLIPFHQNNCYCLVVFREVQAAHAASNYWVDFTTCFRSHMSLDCILILIGFQFSFIADNCRFIRKLQMELQQFPCRQRCSLRDDVHPTKLDPCHPLPIINHVS
jgi:hypothetical protein